MGTEEEVGAGESNTNKIVSKFGNAEPFGKKTDYAAKLCADLVVTKDGVVYDDWFLPSDDELTLMYRYLHRNNIGGFLDDTYWSSSESGSFDSYYKWFWSGQSGSGGSGKRGKYRVRPIRAF